MQLNLKLVQNMIQNNYIYRGEMTELNRHVHKYNSYMFKVSVSFTITLPSELYETKVNF